jgi:hypothetical protein
MFEILVEKIGKTMCRFGFHDRVGYKKEGFFVLFRCRRKGCEYHSPEIKIPPMPPCKEVWDPKNDKNLKMYILICDEVPANVVPLIACHLPMLTYRKFLDRPIMQRWFKTELQKTVVCKVTRQQFEKAKYYGEHFALTEVHHQELGELGLGFNVYIEYPKFLKFLPLWKT